MDLSRIFEPGYREVDLFTDRLAERDFFTEALLQHVNVLGDGEAALSTAERHNVIMYYGVGGVGKTSLSHRLERWLNGDLNEDNEWGAPPRFDQALHTVRIDFHGSASVDAIDIALRLRTAVAGFPRRFPAFDVGLAAWWAHARPGSPLPELRSSTGLDVRGQITDTVKDAINDAGAWLGVGPISVRFAARLFDAVRHRRTTYAALSDCPQLALVMDSARRDASPAAAVALAGLLSWDLEQLSRSEQPLVLAFADAVEYVQGGDRLQERLLHGLVRNTPSVLWVMTTRDPLDWTSETVIRLFDSGRVRWPGLAADTTPASRRHRVGDFDDVDVKRYLRKASGHAGIPILSVDVRDRIRRGAHGLPLYLDLSMALARSADDPLDPALYGQPLPELAILVFSDLSSTERELARTASLLPRFSPGLLAEAAGTGQGDAERFCRRSLVGQDSHAIFPHRLHDAVRAAVVAEDPSHSGAWSPEDRRVRAERLVAALHRRHGRLVDQPDAQLDVLELVTSVVAQHDLRPPWLLDALTDLPMARVAERIPQAPEGPWMRDIARFFRAWGVHTALSRRHYLQELLSTALADDVRGAAARFLAYNYRTDNKCSEALPILAGLLAEEPHSEFLRYQIARTLWQAPDPAGLRAFLAEYPLTDRAAAARVAADLAYDRGDIVTAYEGTAAWARHLRSTGRFRRALDSEASALWRGALAGAVTVADCTRGIDEIDRYGTTLTLRTALAARAVCGLADPDSLPKLLADSDLIVGSGASYRGWREWIPMVLHGLRHNQRDFVEAAYRERSAKNNLTSPNYVLLDRAFVLAGYDSPAPAATLATPTELAAAAGRWTTILESLAAAW